MTVFYGLLKRLTSIAFNMLNVILVGNLPPLGAANVIVEDGGRLLVVETPRRRWTFPGGFMRWHEHPVDTALRECEEETGLRLRIQGVVGHYSTISTSLAKMSTLTITYHGEVAGGTLRASIEGQPRWVDKAELLSRLEEHSAAIFEDYERYRARQAEMKVSGL